MTPEGSGGHVNKSDFRSPDILRGIIAARVSSPNQNRFDRESLWYVSIQFWNVLAGQVENIEEKTSFM